MLNRIYIVVGVFAIVVLAGAFIAPFFIQWSDYRDRMEVLASGVLGAEVTIRGDISFSLLPSPRLEFSDVVVGDLESPVASAAAVEAEFALFDFLRDNYTVTALTLVQPVVDLVLDENGLFSSGVDLAGEGSGVALGHARIADGRVRLTDLRADEVFSASHIDGDLRLSSFTGPFQFQGAADYGGKRYEVRFNSAASDAMGANRISAFLRESAGAYSLTGEGMLTAGMAPKFDGTVVYRQAPPAAAVADDIRGALVLESSVNISTDRVVLSGYTLHPDENRAGMRLTGSANIQLGARRSFDAVVSGGVFSLPPRDATEVPSEQSYELVRLLAEIPPPPVPPMPGRLNIDLAEANLRGFSLRELRLNATSDGSAWRIEQAVAHLPGDTEIRLSGTATNERGRAGFKGDLFVSARRLDALAQLWRRPGDDNPLFNTPGSLEGRIMLAGDAFGLNNGRLEFAGQSHSLEIRLGFGEEPRLDSVVHLGQLSPAQTAGLLALAPAAANDGSFAVSFPNGSFSLTAQTIDLLGLMASELSLEGQWSPSELRLPKVSAGDWGGISLNGALRLAGNLADPRVTGTGQVTVSAADAPGLAAFYEMAGMPYVWQEGLDGVWPGDLRFNLSDAEAGAGQVLTLGGELGAAALDLRADMVSGLSGLAEDDLRLVVSLEAGDAGAAQQQFGLGPVPLFEGDGPMVASLFMEGSGTGGFAGRASISQAGQSISYSGDLTVAPNGELSGQGTLDVLLEDGSGLAALAGLDGASLPAIEASAALRFAGRRELVFTDIAGSSGETGFSGELSMQMLGQLPTFSGTLRADMVDALGLGMALFGKEAIVVPGEGFWPEGPLALTTAPRPSRGDIAVETDAIAANGAPLLGESSFVYAWTPETMSLDRFQAQVGDGRLTLSLAQCCSGPLTERSVTGRMSLSGVEIDALVPPAMHWGLGGQIAAGLQFEGNGRSLGEVVRSLSGEGNFTVADFQASGLAPAVFPTMAGIEDPLNEEADALETLIGLALAQGFFTADGAQGAFSIAGGTARLANLIVDGAGGRLAGSLNLSLNRLGLDGSFVLTPRNYVDPNGLIEPDTARIVARIGGTLLGPLVRLDLAEMVAAIQVRANELELERLDALRREDEARQRAAAAERNRLAEEQRQRAAEETARRAEEEARRLEEEQVPDEPGLEPGETAPTLPLNLGFQPGVPLPN
ncbi:AsmA-like C-terminal region-containing protein [Devosia sp. YIM 151766]|uniref:AsmA family protein n=1 Tax=Devosia sp. YIM 151766 TaxID=3017325 RepID=UPI00255C2BA4|nr:AsmA-like C-terminal region-containing protein [Devosia sp. YIM 151766]WIY51716.1 AsmA-like C-terminal region-containing protein [Devosia sp. YIM 151766]